ncbi:MAG: CopG family transcriptional regulator [Chloroflexota bacterium]
MPTPNVRATIYIEPSLHQALRLKAANAHRSISEIVNDAIRESLREDEEDGRAFGERESETSLSYDEFLTRLRTDRTR